MQEKPGDIDLGGEKKETLNGKEKGRWSWSLDKHDDIEWVGKVMKYEWEKPGDKRSQII